MAFCRKYQVGVPLTFPPNDIRYVTCDGNVYPDPLDPPLPVNPGVPIDLDGIIYPCAQQGSFTGSTPNFTLLDMGGCGSSTVYTFIACADSQQFSVSGIPFTTLVSGTTYSMDFGRFSIPYECATYDSSLSSSGTTYSVLGEYYDTNTGYTCASSVCTDIYIDCSGNTYPDFCLRGTGTYDDTYKPTPFYYNFRNYFTGETTNFFAFFSLQSSRWCISNSLGGTCFLSGPSIPQTNCPNFASIYWSNGVCPTPTPSPTINCDALEFEAIFNCEVTNTPTPTPTIPTTPTPTPTPTDPTCANSSISGYLTAITPTPSPTLSPTPTPSGIVDRPCNFVGEVTFTTVNTQINCPISRQFQDCFTGLMYYTTQDIGTQEQFGVYSTIVDGVSRCMGYIGLNYDVIGVNDITIIDGPLGYLNLGGCVNCTPDPTITPTLTPTPTITPSTTPTPTPTPIPTYYVYQKCAQQTIYLIQTQPGPTTQTDVVFSDTGRAECWIFKFSQQNTPPTSASLNTPYVTNYSGNYFIGPYLYEGVSCASCLATL